MISAKLLSDYRKALSTVADAAGDVLRRSYADLVARGATGSVLRDGMLEAAWSVSSELGNLASVAAADFYDAIRFSQLPGGVDFQAILADLPDYRDVQRQAHMSARFMFDREGTQGRTYSADPEMFLRELVANVERMVLDAARDTIGDSAVADPLAPRVKLVARPGACDYCANAAAKGWRVASASAGHGVFHDHCRCFTVPSWDEGSGVQRNPFRF